MNIRVTAIYISFFGIVLMAGPAIAADGKCECYYKDGSPVTPPCQYVSEEACAAAAKESFIGKCDFAAGVQCPVISTDEFLRQLRTGSESRQK
jgi:hypothetical protein